ncbi:MAG: hypothetical protein AB1422_14420, partial [bacterium]
ILNSCSFLAKGYDMFDNYLTEISSYKWQVEQFIGSLTPQIGSRTLFTAGTKALIGTVSVTSGTITGMATITIIPGAVDYIQITPGFATIRVTESLMFYAQGYDKYHNLIPELSYNWSVIGGSILPAIGSSTLFTAGIVVCEGMIMATSSGKSAFASITITPGELHHINIFPQTQTVSILNSCSFLAKGYDMFDNYLTEISSYKWQVEQFIGSLTPQIGSMTLFTAGTKALIGTVSVTSGTITGMATITIIPGQLHHLIITPATVTLSITTSCEFYVNGYDYYDNPILNVICNWEVIPTSLGQVNPVIGTSTTFTAGLSPITGIIKATNGTIIGTSTIFLSESELDHFNFEVIPHQVGGKPFPVTITARDVYNNLVDFDNEISLCPVPENINLTANGRFVDGLWQGTITINTVALDIQLIANFANIRGTSNTFAALIDDNYGTVTAEGNTILTINPKSLNGTNYYVMINANPENLEIKNANLADDQDTKLDGVRNSIREIKIIDGDKKLLDYDFGNATFLIIPFDDNDQDKIVDGTNILEKSLRLHILENNQWKPVNTTPTIDRIGNRVKAQIYKMGTYVLMGYAVQPNLSNFIVYPVPFKPQRGDKEIIFEGLPMDCKIRIYDIAGSLRRFVEHIEGYWCWDVRDDYGHPLESGVYIYIITDNEEEKKTGKIAVIR